MGIFVIKKRNNGEFQFNLKASNGQVILTSEGYSTKSGCLIGRDSVKVNSPYDSRYERRISSNGKYFFNLKSSNGQVIGTSELYEGSSGRENGIESVKINAPNALTQDLT